MKSPVAWQRGDFLCGKNGYLSKVVVSLYHKQRTLLVLVRGGADRAQRIVDLNVHAPHGGYVDGDVAKIVLYMQNAAATVRIGIFKVNGAGAEIVFYVIFFEVGTINVSYGASALWTSRIPSTNDGGVIVLSLRQQEGETDADEDYTAEKEPIVDDVGTLRFRQLLH